MWDRSPNGDSSISNSPFRFIGVTTLAKLSGSHTWCPIEEFASAEGARVEIIRARIASGTLSGALIQGQWYVISNMVQLKIADPTRAHRAILELHAAVENGVYSAGYGLHELRLKYDHEEIRTAIGQLTAAEAQNSGAPVEIILSRRTIRLHRSLHGDMLGVLLEWQIEVKHRDALKQYPPGLDFRKT